MVEENIAQESNEESVSDRPEYIPEKFWDADNKSANVEALASSYNALEKKLGQRTEDLTKSIREDLDRERLSSVPESYEITVPEGIPEDIEVNFNDDQPLMNWWKDFAKSKGLNQNDFNDGVKAFINSELSMNPNPEEEMKKLGDNAKERVEAADIWAKKYLSSKAYNKFQELSSSADGIEALEEIMNLNKSTPLPSDTAIQEEVSELDLRSMMKDPKYWDPQQKDPAYIKRVSDLYEKKYGQAS
jgi:hypothetical protein